MADKGNRFLVFMKGAHELKNAAMAPQAIGGVTPRNEKRSKLLLLHLIEAPICLARVAMLSSIKLPLFLAGDHHLEAPFAETVLRILELQILIELIHKG
jgi:hypothetical protein